MMNNNSNEQSRGGPNPPQLQPDEQSEPVEVAEQNQQAEQFEQVAQVAQVEQLNQAEQTEPIEPIEHIGQIEHLDVANFVLPAVNLEVDRDLHESLRTLLNLSSPGIVVSTEIIQWLALGIYATLSRDEISLVNLMARGIREGTVANPFIDVTNSRPFKYTELLTEFTSTPLTDAAYEGNLEFVQRYFENKNNVENDANDRDEINTALRMAAKKGHLEIVKLLLEKGGSPAIPDELANTALLLAANASNIEVTVELLKYLLIKQQKAPTFHEIVAFNGLLKLPFPQELEPYLKCFAAITDLDPPNEFCCPVNLTLMRAPMLASDGRTYEKEALRTLFINTHRSPISRGTLADDLYPNRALQSLIESNFISQANEAIQKYFKEAIEKEGQQQSGEHDAEQHVEQNIEQRLMVSASTSFGFFNNKSEQQEQVRVPAEYTCFLTKQLMKDPVVASDGYSYEREALATYRTSNNCSPVTGEVLKEKVYDNLILKNIIEEHQQAQVLQTHSI